MADRVVTVDIEMNDGEAKQKLAALDKQADATGDTMSDHLTISAQQAEEALAEVGMASQKTTGIFGQTRTAINQLAEASGITYQSLGLLGSGFAVAGAAMAGWEIGRAVMELTGLDAQVEKGWRNLLGYADAGVLAAAHKTETLAKASAIAGREITNVNQAIKILEDNFRRTTNANIDWNEKLAAAQREVRGLSEVQRNGIEVAQKAGASVQEITDKYKISALALELLGDRKKLATQMAEAHAKAIEKEKAATEAYNIEIANQRVLFDNLDKQAAAAQLAKAKEKGGAGFMEAVNASAEATRLEQARIAANQAEIDRLTQVAEAHTTVGDAAQAAGDAAVQASNRTTEGYAGVMTQVTLTGEAIKEYINLMRYSASVNAILSENSLFTTTSQRQRIAGLDGGFGAGSSGPPSVPAPVSMGGGGGGSPISLSFSIGSVDSESRANSVVQQVMREVSTIVNADRRQTMSRS